MTALRTRPDSSSPFHRPPYFVLPSGRGTSLYDEPSYDTRTLSSFIPVPCSGFLCNGEIGSVGGTTHLHGFTCAAGVVRLVAPQGGSEHEPKTEPSVPVE